MIRSLLYVPAIAPRYVTKAHERGADAVILDLEDSIAPAQKDAARAALAAAVPVVGQSGAIVFVRVNSEADRQRADIEAASAAGAFGVLLPKTRDPAALRATADWLDTLERETGRPMLRFIPLLEYPGAVLDARAIAKATPRNFAIVTGGEDLATAMDGEAIPELLSLPKQLVHLAAKEAGLLSFGLMRTIADFNDTAAIAASARLSRSLGFDGASCIHPAVVPILNAAFGPTPAQVDHAERLVAAFDAARAEGLGAFTFDGHMVDLPIVERARRLLTRKR